MNNCKKTLRILTASILLGTAALAIFKKSKSCCCCCETKSNEEL